MVDNTKNLFSLNIKLLSKQVQKGSNKRISNQFNIKNKKSSEKIKRFKYLNKN